MEVLRLNSSGVPVAITLPGPQESQSVAARSIVHSVAGDNHSGALAASTGGNIPKKVPSTPGPSLPWARPKTSEAGSCTRAQARLTLCFIPPLRFITCSPLLLQRSTSLITSSTLARNLPGLPKTINLPKEGDVLSYGEFVVKGGKLRHVSDLLSKAARKGSCPAWRSRQTGEDDPHQYSDQGGLARAVGTQQAIAHPSGDLQAEVVNGLQTPVVESQTNLIRFASTSAWLQPGLCNSVAAKSCSGRFESFGLSRQSSEWRSFMVK